MHAVVFAREGLAEIWIAFPVRVCIAVSQPRIAGSIGLREPCVRQRIAKRMADEFCRCGVAHEVTLVAGLAPFSFRVPMPSLNVQFRVLPVTDRLPASRENPLYHRFGEDFVG